jgi:phospholipase C
MTPEELRGLVDTIVVVMLENRSFDHLLGYLSHEDHAGRTDVEGLHRPGPNFRWANPDATGKAYPPTATPDSHLPFDLPHSRKKVAAQLRSGAMDGFIKAYFAWQSNDRSPAPMRFCTPADVPVTAALAEGYTVCDHWFASLPTDTQPNRLMALCGGTRIDSTSAVKLPFHLLPNQLTIFDYLARKGERFAIYVDSEPLPALGVPSNLLLMRSQWGHLRKHAQPLERLRADWNDPTPAPAVIYCEPLYNDFAVALKRHGTCNHAPLPLAFGEGFLKRVYAALTSNPARWARTLLVVCYDEHGGFFDHVRPPEMRYAPPAGSDWVDRNAFTTLGVRIPGLVVSPLVEPRSVFKGRLDHTSILQLMVERFGSPIDLAEFGDALARKTIGHVQSLGALLTRSAPRADVPQVAAAPTATSPSALAPLNETGRMFQAVLNEARASRRSALTAPGFDP